MYNTLYYSGAVCFHAVVRACRSLLLLLLGAASGSAVISAAPITRTLRTRVGRTLHTRLHLYSSLFEPLMYEYSSVFRTW